MLEDVVTTSMRCVDASIKVCPLSHRSPSLRHYLLRLEHAAAAPMSQYSLATCNIQQRTRREYAYIDLYAEHIGIL